MSISMILCTERGMYLFYVSVVGYVSLLLFLPSGIYLLLFPNFFTSSFSPLTLPPSFSLSLILSLPPSYPPSYPPSLPLTLPLILPLTRQLSLPSLPLTLPPSPPSFLPSLPPSFLLTFSRSILSGQSSFWYESVLENIPKWCLQVLYKRTYVLLLSTYARKDIK